MFIVSFACLTKWTVGLSIWLRSLLDISLLRFSRHGPLGRGPAVDLNSQRGLQRIFLLAWVHLGIFQEEMESVNWENDVWNSLLCLLCGRWSTDSWMDGCEVKPLIGLLQKEMRIYSSRPVTSSHFQLCGLRLPSITQIFALPALVNKSTSSKFINCSEANWPHLETKVNKQWLYYIYKKKGKIGVKHSQNRDKDKLWTV